MGACTAKPNSSKTQKKTPEARKTQEPRTSERSMTIRRDNIRHFYDIREKIAEGGFGSVFSARSVKTGKSRAIKLIKIAGRDPADIENQLREASILKSTDHPNILKIYEVFRDRTHLYFVTELLRGGELFDRIVKKGALTENQAAFYMIQMVSAIVHIHSLSIVHRDLKPENILFNSKKEDSVLKIIDFGTSRHFVKNVQMGERIGSVYYMAPEVITGNYDEKCDIWSLGVILFILLSGYPPFSGADDKEILMSIVKGHLKFEGKCWETVSQSAIDLIKSMLNTKSSSRPTALEVYQNTWIQSHGKNEAPDKELTKMSLKSLSCFNTTNHLQRATLNFIANELMSQEELEHLHKLFKKIDENGDGFLSSKEIEKAITDHPGVFTGNVKEMLSKVDTDQNGMINYSEFLTAATNWEKELSNERLHQAFRQFDKDGNGTLSIEELYDALGGNSGQNLQFLDLIKEADINHDNQIDLEEFVAFMKKVVLAQ